jgi:hypothetical protein
MFQKIFARWVCVYSHYRRLDGLFYLMYNSKTTIKNGFAVVEIYENGQFWHTYEFPVGTKYDFIEHITGKIWGTIAVLLEINKAIEHYEQHGANL